MSTRYVWEKWNVEQTAVKSYSSNFIDMGARTSAYIVQGKSYSISNNRFTLNNGQAMLVGAYPAVQFIEITGGNWFAHILNDESNPAKASTTVLYKSNPDGLSITYSKSIDPNELQLSARTDWYAVGNKKGSTSYGNVSSASSGAYPANSYSGNYWYVSKGNDTIDPASVTYPASPNGGELVDITIAPSTGIKFGGTIKYKVEYQLNGGSWQTAVEATTSTTVSVLIPKGTQTFAARTTASDDTGFTSTTAVTGETVNVVNNAAPVISCGTSSLGEIAEPFSVTYSVSDEDGDTMTITEKIDGTVIRSYSAPSGSAGEQTFSPDAMQWLTTLNGSHTATITADDGKGGVTTHSISFTRAVHTMTVTLEEPMETDAAITKCVVNIARNLPADAEWSLLVTNNAFDPKPVWEDITQYVKNGWNWVFENQTVTSGRYGFNFKLTCTRGASGKGGSVDTISGGFE